MRLSVTTKVFLGLALLVLTFGSVSLFGVVQLHAIGKDLEQVSQTFLPLAKLSAELESAQKNRARDLQRLTEEDRAIEVQALMLRIARSQHPKNLQRLAQASALCKAGLGRARGLSETRTLENLVERLDDLKHRTLGYDATAGSLQRAIGSATAAAAHPQALESPPLRITAAAEALRATERRLGLSLRQFAREVDLEVARQVSRAETREDQAALAIMLLSLLAVIVGFAVTLFVQRTLHPVQRLTDAVREVRGGRFDQRVAVGTHDEIGVLGEAFNEMTAALAARDAMLAKQREALLRSERLATIGKMAAQVSHEIRNPLSSVGLNSELLADEIKEAHFDQPQRQEEALTLIAAIGTEIDRLTEITEDYLGFAKLPAPRLQSLDLPPLLQDLASFLKEEMNHASLTLSLELPSQVDLVAADPSQLRATLLNLLRNARQACAPGGHISIGLAQRPECVELWVDDDGPGVPEPRREQIFEPFFSTRDHGTGLGLALCAQIIAEHGGQLLCQASPLGGARFSMSLPKQAPSTKPGLKSL